MKNLGFGMMRLPVLNGNPTDFDYEQLNKMVDAFLEAGYNYFDTSYVYHEGKSEEAVRKALVERHPRDSFRVATKFPSFIPMSEAIPSHGRLLKSSRMNPGIWITEITLDMSPVRVPNLSIRIAYGINNQFPGLERSKQCPNPAEIICVTVLLTPNFEACIVS